MTDLTQLVANTTKAYPMCKVKNCGSYSVGRHGSCSNHKLPSYFPEFLAKEVAKNREHILGCDEMHGHVAPRCCCTSCWCLPERSFNKDSNTALTRWEKTSKKLTEDQRAHLYSFVHTLEVCLKYGNGQIWLGLEAHSMLAWEFYQVDSTEDPPPRPKGRRDAIEHTRKINEAG